MKSYKLAIGFSVMAMLTTPVVANPVSATPGNNDDLTEKIQQWEEQGIDPNHTDAIDNIMGYIEENIDDDVFASLHIDREERELGVLVFSFTEPISEDHKQAMEQFVTEHAEIAFREVNYTEEELIAKQNEIDLKEFENEGITIYHTSLDTIGNKVEVGISPYTEENATIVKERYGDDMTTVVESVQPSLLEDTDQAETGKSTEQAEDDHNIFQKVLHSIKDFFGNVFK